MTVNKFKDLSMRSALPAFDNQTAIQRGNSTHKSLFEVAFFMQLHHLDHSLCDVVTFKYKSLMPNKSAKLYKASAFNS